MTLSRRDLEAFRRDAERARKLAAEMRKLRFPMPTSQELRLAADVMKRHGADFERARRQMVATESVQAQFELHQKIRRSFAQLGGLEHFAEAARLLQTSVQRFFGDLRDSISRAAKAVPLVALSQVLSAIQEEEPEVLAAFDATEEPAASGDAAASESSDLAVPPAVRERLLQVEFVPITVMRKIAAEPELLHGLPGRKFEEFTAQLLDDLGFEDVVLTPRSGDGGRDVLAVGSFRGISMLMAFECKRHKGSARPEWLRALLGTIHHPGTVAGLGVLVTTASLTKGCRDIIVTDPRIDAKDFDDIVRWLSIHRG